MSRVVSESSSVTVVGTENSASRNESLFSRITNGPAVLSLVTKARRFYERQESEVRQLKLEAEELHRTMTPDEFTKWIDERCEKQKKDATEAVDSVKAEINKTRPSRSDYPGTPEGQKAFEAAMAAWMGAAAAVVDTTQNWINFFKSLVEKAKQMIRDVAKLIREAVQKAYHKVREFLLWFADAIAEWSKRKQL